MSITDEPIEELPTLLEIKARYKKLHKRLKTTGWWDGAKEDFDKLWLQWAAHRD